MADILSLQQNYRSFIRAISFVLLFCGHILPGLGKSGQLSSTFISVDTCQTPQESLYFIFKIIEDSCKRVVGCYLAVLQNQNLAQFYGPEFVILLTHPNT